MRLMHSPGLRLAEPESHVHSIAGDGESGFRTFSTSVATSGLCFKGLIRWEVLPHGKGASDPE